MDGGGISGLTTFGTDIPVSSDALELLACCFSNSFSVTIVDISVLLVYYPSLVITTVTIKCILCTFFLKQDLITLYRVLCYKSNTKYNNFISRNISNHSLNLYIL